MHRTGLAQLLFTARQALPNLLALPPTHVTRRRVVWRALR